MRARARARTHPFARATASSQVIHPTKHTIYLSRHGQSEYNVRAQTRSHNRVAFASVHAFPHTPYSRAFKIARL
eukprot:2970857-Pleurochrysis_carterae.AAC.2